MNVLVRRMQRSFEFVGHVKSGRDVEEHGDDYGLRSGGVRGGGGGTC